jgi:hypothetical protein
MVPFPTLTLFDNAAKQLSEPNDRRRIQEALFPNGLVWDGERIGTAVIIPAFSWL